MNENSDFGKDEPSLDELSAFSEIGDAFRQTKDPLEEYSREFKKLDVEPIDLYIDNILWEKELVDKTLEERENVLRNWETYIDTFERHPVCVNAAHAARFIQAEIDKNNKKQSILRKIRVIERMYDTFNEEEHMPHGTGNASNYNPITSAKKKKENDLDRCEKEQEKSKHNISVEELRHVIRNIENLLHRSVIGVQYKYGNRAGQASNYQLIDVQLCHDELKELYPRLGTNPHLERIDSPAIYVPSRFERAGSKSENSVVMPIDMETRQLLIKYLQIRPPTDKPWLFINPTHVGKLRTGYINQKMWHTHFRPKYGATDIFEPVSSHFARHQFTTYWKKEQNIQDEYIKYMRGDEGTESMDDDADFYDYVHTNFTDIKDIYLNQIYKLDLA